MADTLTKQEKLYRIGIKRKQYGALLYDLVLEKRFAVMTKDEAQQKRVETEAVKLQKVLDELDKIAKEVEAEAVANGIGV